MHNITNLWHNYVDIYMFGCLGLKPTFSNWYLVGLKPTLINRVGLNYVKHARCPNFKLVPQTHNETLYFQNFLRMLQNSFMDPFSPSNHLSNGWYEYKSP